MGKTRFVGHFDGERLNQERRGAPVYSYPTHTPDHATQLDGIYYVCDEASDIERQLRDAVVLPGG